MRVARVHGIGRHEGKSHVAVALDDDVSARSLPSSLRAANLRSWFGVIDDATLSIAMRAVQVLEWDRTHRFCGACGYADRSGRQRKHQALSVLFG